METYNQFFYYRIARTPEDIAAAHRLRYEVYCEETGFLPKEEHPDGLERDEHDEHSIQSVLFYRPLNLPAGTVRVVRPKPGEEGCGLPARLAAPGLDLLPEKILPCGRTGEISRFSIHGGFRKRQSDGLYAAIHDPRQGGGDPRRILPHMTLGLMTSIFEIALETNLTHLCAIIDPALLRMLRMLGLRFEAVGPLVEFHGPRQPVFAPLKQLIDGVARDYPEVHEVITAGGRLSIDGRHAAA
ncbi:MAG TPA: PEP-CTERM/exosortase system-associated acyltransferase [Pedomonas sp.]|nr:PEP-CTERM/exosortase system-associated acyltransferase [Pedomonas sp.]